MEDDPANTQSQASSYIQTQFFFYMLTCYYAIVAFSIRYNKIMKQPPQINVNRLPGQFLITSLENQPQFVPGVKDTPPVASYVIKSKLCLFNSYLYLFMFAFSLIGTQDIFYACKHRQYSIIYLFGFAAWTLAAVVLRREYQRNMYQSLWTHRIFWIFSGTFAITKMFQDYLLPMNLVLNCFSIATNVVLSIYGIYRAQDNDTLTIIDNQDIPGMFKLFFQYIQLNSFVRKMFKIQQNFNQGVKQPIDAQNLGQIDIQTLQQAFKVTTQSRRQQINLLNQLPRRNIFIDKKLQYIKNPNGTVKICYFIFTQIGNNRFEASRAYKQFIKLQDDLAQTFSEKNFPKIVLPRIRKSQNPQNTNQSQILQQWLVQIVKKPLLMIKPLLVFLNINQQSSAPFTTYFQISYKSFCSNAYMITQLRKRETKKDNVRVSLVGYYDEGDTNTSNMSNANVHLASMIKEKLEFMVEVDDQVTESEEFGFLITCIREGKNRERIRWKLLKREENILAVNYRIEQQCKISIPFYYQMVSNLSKTRHDLKAKSFSEYISKLLNNSQYYCIALFQFIRFDPIAMQVRLGGMDISSINKGNAKDGEGKFNRISHYFQEFEDHPENLVAVIRVDRIKKGGEEDDNVVDQRDKKQTIFKFQIRRRSFVQFRTSQQILKLRKELAQIYQGVCFVPAISYQYEQCNKYQAKQRTQRFLNALENLPKILINQSFSKFYQHTL